MRTFSYRLILAGIIVLSGIYLGSNLYAPRIKSKVSVKSFSENLKKVSTGGIEIKIDEDRIFLNNEDLKNWVELYQRDYSKSNDLRISSSEFNAFMESLAVRYSIEPVNARFELKDSKVQVFQPSVVGKKIDVEKSSASILKAIYAGSSSVTLATEDIQPEITLESVNSLGINTLLARGESNFGGSSQSRIHNIKVAINKFNGLILKPNEEFSFNKALGDVDEKEGYQPELVIKNKKLVLEYGGGVCQVSTTLFRSAIYAGLPIIERRPHSFPVRYYNPQGFDSTVYPGITDLRFLNNTPNHILIQTRVVKLNLIFEIFGSSDGRSVKLEGPFQYDKKSDGSLRAYFKRKIFYNDELAKEERFNSVYRSPPSAHERNPLE